MNNITSPGDNGRRAAPGDVILARYRWADKPNETGKKVRPCVVLNVKDDGSSMILAPVSTKPDWKAMDCLEIPPEERPTAGLTDDHRSFIKLTEINRVELPSLAIVPQVKADGRLAWSQGKVSKKILEQVQEEVAFRLNDKTLKGVRIEADRAPQMTLSGIRKVSSADRAARDQRVAQAARRLADRCETPAAKPKMTESEAR